MAMRGLIWTLALASGWTQAAGPELTERFHGTGRACSGELIIRQAAISWVTPFSTCASVPDELLEQGNDGGNERRTYRLLQAPPACRYRILFLTHDKSMSPNAGWEITAYGQEQSYRRDKESGYQADAPDMMSCYLLRQPGRHANPQG
ncbi:hypothetical protein ACLB1G_10470 [Oxalobacteraceae bacterium A2-2]